MVTIALILFGAVAAAAFVYSRYAATRLRHLSHYERWSDEFFREVKPLLSDDRTPSAVLEVVAFLNRQIVSDRAARSALSSFAYRVDPKVVASTSLHRDLETFSRDLPELSDAFGRACLSAMRAISYRSPFAGFFLRRLYLFDDQVARERPRQLAERFRSRNHDDIGQCPMAA